MDKLLVFVNFIEASQRALDQAISLAKVKDSSIVICHIIRDETDESEILAKLKPYSDQVEKEGINVTIELEHGAVFDAAARAAQRIKPDLVVAGTRGVEGFDMSIFGSAIYKFVRDVSYTSLVMHPQSEIANGGFHKIMLPISPHPNFIKKVEESVKVLSDQGEVIVFTLIKKDTELDEDTAKNVELTKAYLDEHQINWKSLEMVTEKHDHSFAAQTLEQMKEQGMDLVSISADVSARNKHFGKMHKEDILLNESGIPVLCVNTDT